MRAEHRPRLKACVVLNSLMVGGSETQLLRMCQRMDPGEVALDVVYYGRVHVLLNEYRKTPARVTFIDKDGMGKAPFLLALAAHLRRGRYDVVHCWLGTANQYGVLAALWGGARCILTGHRSLDPPSRLRRWFDRAMAPFTAGRMVNSEAIRACHSRRTGYPHDKLVVLHNGLDPDEFADPAPREDTRSALGLREDLPLIVNVGRLDKVKGLGLFLRLAEEMTRRGRSVQFALVGDGPDRAALEREAREKGLADRVLFLGIRRDVPDILAAADLSVSTSPEEGLPNVVLEAMFTGTPVLSADNGGGPEVLENPEQVFPAGDLDALVEKVTALLDEPELGRGWARKGKERAREEFSADLAARRYTDLLRKTVQDHRRGDRS